MAAERFFCRSVEQIERARLGGAGLGLTDCRLEAGGRCRNYIGAVDIDGVQLSKISRLGTCAEGKPISGELRVCTGKLP